jgi:aspartate aminotransferase
LRPLLEVLKRHPQVWLLSDDIYEHLLYDGAAFVTAAQLARGLCVQEKHQAAAAAAANWRDP